MLPVDRKKRHKICKKTQIFRHFLRQLKQALAFLLSGNSSLSLGYIRLIHSIIRRYCFLIEVY